MVLQYHPTLGPYQARLEQQLQALGSPEFDFLWHALRLPSPTTAETYWAWYMMVLEASRKISIDRESLNDLVDLVLENCASRSELTDEQLTTVHWAVFAVMCWASAVVDPLMWAQSVTRKRSEAAGTTSSSQKEAPLKLNSPKPGPEFIEVERTLCRAFQSLRRDMEDLDATDHAFDTIHANTHLLIHEDAILESTITYTSLRRIANIKIGWVDTIYAHLDFDKTTRTLSLYCFPSYCAAHAGDYSRPTVAQDILSIMLSQDGQIESSRSFNGIHAEILLTYRVLFGQSPSSGALLLREIDRELRDGDVISTDQWGKDAAALSSARRAARRGTQPTVIVRDPMISALCTLPSRPERKLRYLFLKNTEVLPIGIFPASVSDRDGRLQERSTYSLSDFQTFGHKLLELQRFNQRQQPSRLLDIWRDRRNVAQWYTFWAVVIVGGCGILLGILQLITGIVQIYYSAAQATHV